MELAQLTYVILILITHLPTHQRPCGIGEVPCGDYAVEIAQAFLLAQHASGGDVAADELLSIALLETGDTLARDAHGKHGRGIFGLNPRTFHYQVALMICDAMPEKCVEAQALVATALLLYEMRRCGAWSRAVNSYSSGRCYRSRGSARYARALEIRRRRVRQLMGHVQF